MDFREEKSSEENQEAIQAVLSHGTQDHVLRRLVDKSSCFLFPKLLVSILDEGSLLEDNEESHLNDQERAAAEAEYDREIAAERAFAQPRPVPAPYNPSTALANMVMSSTDPLIDNPLEIATAAVAVALTQQAPQTPLLNQPNPGEVISGPVRATQPGPYQPTPAAPSAVAATGPAGVSTALTRPMS